MNKLARKIKSKGYSMPEFLEIIGRCLRWYRQHEHKDNKQNKMIVDAIDDLEGK